MDIIFIDPGYGKGFSIPRGGSLTSVESEEYNPVNGVAFTGNSCYALIPYSTLNVPNGSVRRLSLRFSVYCKDMVANSNDLFRAGIQISPTVQDFPPLAHNHVRIGLNICSPISDNLTQFSNFNNGFHNVVISTLRTSNTGFARDDFEADSFAYTTFNSGGYPTGYPFGSGILFEFPAAGTFYVSNIILATSTELIDTEPTSTSPAPLLTSDSLPVSLTLSKPTGDFTSVGGGEYVGNASGQKLLQTIDTTAAVAKFGDTSKVSHLVVYGNPGYRVGSNITEAYGISKDGNSSITSHGSCELSTDTDATTCVAWETPDTKLPDLDGLKVGWQI